MFQVGVMMLMRGVEASARGRELLTERIASSQFAIVIAPCAWRDDQARWMGT